MSLIEKITKMPIPILLISLAVIVISWIIMRKRKRVASWIAGMIAAFKVAITYVKRKTETTINKFVIWFRNVRARIILFYIVAISRLKVILNKIVEKSKTILCLVCGFFRNKKALLCVIFANALNIGTYIVCWRMGKTFPFSLLIWPLVSSILFAFAFYAEDFLAWCDNGHKLIGRIVSSFFSVFSFLSPVLSFLCLTYASKLYFANSLQGYQIVIVSLFVVLQCMHVVHYCYELREVNTTRFSLTFRIQYFVSLIIHIIQIFAYIYLLLLLLNHTSLGEISSASPFELGCDLTFFSAMTFLGRDGLLKPESVLAKLVVLIESFIFTVYVSIVILGILSNNHKEGSGKG